MKFRLIVLLSMSALAAFLGCTGDEIHPVGRFDVSGPVVSGDLDPMKHALQVLSLQASDLQRPVAYEEDYRTLARLPLIDQLSRSPFLLQQWAEETSANFQQAAEIGIADLLLAAAETLNGGVRYPDRKLSQTQSGLRLADAVRYMYDKHDTAPDVVIFDSIHKAGLAVSFEQALCRLVISLTDASLLLGRAYAGLSDAEKSYLREWPERYFFPDGKTFNFLTAPTHTQTKLLSIAQKIDFADVFTAAAWATRAVDEFMRSLPEVRQPAQFFRNSSAPNGFRLDVPTPLGSIIIAGMDDDKHFLTGLLTIDIGGNDIYQSVMRAVKRPAGRLSVLIDLDGDDVHDAKSGRAAQGFGNLSVDLLVDLHGNDYYRAGDLSQGCGIFGVGMLADYDGSDTYEMGLIGQGFGLFGVGILIDHRGGDRYTMTGLGQGAGATMGAGILCDGEGNDKYLADRNRVRGNLQPDDWSHVQGVGLSVRSPDWRHQASIYGGIGFLSDGGGDDFYYSSHENCMGASYLLSIGALVDHGGDDQYIPEKGLGIGYAVHLGTAVFIDHDGDDRYYGNLMSGGSAADRSIAIMIDHSGDDIYGPSEDYLKIRIKNEAQNKNEALSEADLLNRLRPRLAQNAYAAARKPRAFGMLIDFSGNDRYTANPDGFGGSFGGLLAPVEPKDWSHAILFDLGGKDVYSYTGRKNNQYVKSMGHALCYDTEVSASVFGNGTDSVRVGEYLKPKRRSSAAVEDRNFQAAALLGDPDAFKRFSARGRFVGADDSVGAKALLRKLQASENNELNMELLEIVDALLFAGNMPDGPKASLMMLLDARDPSVRIFAAGRLGRWKIRSALGALLLKANDPDETVRVQFIRAIGRISDTRAVDFLLEVGSTDPSIVCRREAFLALSGLAASGEEIQPEIADKISANMISALDIKDEIIRTAAAAALVCCVGRPSVNKALNRSLLDESVYVQRAAAKSLIASGTKSAIPVLIESLRFPSIDTRQHYDHELAKDLAFYCGIDFPAQSRYEYTTWKNWWVKNNKNVDLELNLAIRSQIEQAFAQKTESDGIALFELMRSRYPHNVVIRNRYTQYCREWITMRLLTRKQVDHMVLRRCLRLQEIVTNLQPDEAEHWVGLAYFQYRLGNYQNALAGMETALQIDPDNPFYRELRDAYRLLLKQNRKDNTPKPAQIQG